MADFTALKTAIQNAIKQNGNEEITGNLLQEVLLAIVTTLGDGSINDLITALGSEATTRQQADGTLQQNINAEAQARQLADSTLQGGINTVSAAITAINNAITNGCVYAGIATPSSTPASGKVFYLALTAGTYTKFNSLVVPQGINILKNNGSTWSLDSFLGIDDAPTQGSANLVKSGGVLNSIIQNGPAFDLSAYNAQGGVLATYADLSAALTALNALPSDFKKGGMSVKFILSSDNRYMQFRLKTNSFSPYAHHWSPSVILNYATNLVGITINLENKPSLNKITVSLDEPYGFGLIYHKNGWVTVDNSISTDLTTVNGLNIIYFDSILQQILLTNSINNLNDDCVILEVLYMTNGEASDFCWTTPLVTKTNFGYLVKNAASYATEQRIIDIVNNQVTSKFKQYLHVTNIYGIELVLTNNGNSTVTLDITGDGYIFHEKGFVGASSSLSKTLSLTNGNNLNFIYYCNATSSIEITTDINVLTENDIIFEAFYSMGGSPNNAFWTTPYISKVNFLDAFDRVCCYQRSADIKTLQTSVSGLEKQIHSPFPYSLNIFKRIACIGDSYTEGLIQPTGETAIINKNYAWPHYLENLSKTIFDNYGISGSTTRLWMSGTTPLITQIQGSGKKAQAYIIGLGLNDNLNSDVKVPCGTQSDINTDADTYYAWYYKIIQAAFNVNDKAVVFCTTCPGYPIDDIYNVAVRDIVSYCKNNGQKVYLVDLASNEYMTTEYWLNPVFTADAVNFHYTAIGYEFMAECLHKILSDVINDNITDFQNVAYIPYDNLS